MVKDEYTNRHPQTYIHTISRHFNYLLELHFFQGFKKYIVPQFDLSLSKFMNNLFKGVDVGLERTLCPTFFTLKPLI